MPHFSGFSWGRLAKDNEKPGNNEFWCPNCRTRYFLTAPELASCTYVCSHCRFEFKLREQFPARTLALFAFVVAAITIVLLVLVKSQSGHQSTPRQLPADLGYRLSELTSRDISESFAPAIAFADSLYSLGFETEPSSLLTAIIEGYFHRRPQSYFESIYPAKWDLQTALDGFEYHRQSTNQAIAASRLLSTRSHVDSLRMLGDHMTNILLIFSAALDTLEFKITAAAQDPDVSPLVGKYGLINGLKVAAGITWIGMTSDMVRDIYGTPEDVNSQMTANGKWEQWVYWRYEEKRWGKHTILEMTGESHPVWTGKGRFFYFIDDVLYTWQESK